MGASAQGALLQKVLQHQGQICPRHRLSQPIECSTPDLLKNKSRTSVKLFVPPAIR